MCREVRLEAAGPAPLVSSGDARAFLDVAGEMPSRIRAHDWRRNPLGPPEAWPQPLRTLVGLMLASMQPMFIAWGPQRIWLYNDAFVPILGDKHPHALGRPALDDVWSEARDVLTPLFDRVYSGEPVHMQDFALFLHRHGRLEEAHFAYSYTPARDEAGAVAGLFGACIETTDQILAKRRQAAEQERQRRQFEQAPGFIAILSGPAHIFEFTNEAYARLAGHRELIGRSVREAFPELRGQGPFERLDRVYATGERYVASDVALRLQRGPGSAVEERFLSFVYAPITDESGNVTGIFVEGQDVTDVHRAQEQLHKNERRQAFLVELDDRFRDLDQPAELSFAAAELLGRALSVSRAGYGTVDLKAETIDIERDWNAPGIKSLAGKLHFRDYGSYIEDLKRGETVIFADAEKDPRTRATADALKAISAQAVVNMPVTEQNGLVALLYLNHDAAREWTGEELAFIRNVAERTRMAVARRRAENDLLALTASLERQVAERTAERDRVWQNSRDLLVVVGADGMFRAVNPAWTTILGHQPGDVLGRSFLDFVWPEDAERTRAGLASAATKSDLTHFENRYRHKDGSPRWISWHTTVEDDRVYAYGRDITTQKEQSLALQQAEDALRQSQKLEAMGQLTGGVAHDFNNLLTPIIGGLDMLQRRSNAGEREQRLIAAALQSAERAKTLVHRLLAFARRQPLQPTRVDVADVVRGMADLVASTTGPQIRLVVDVADGLPAAIADTNQLEMAILNLSVNARDAMPDGGTLQISADFRLAPPGNAMNVQPGAYVCIRVSDTGFGMDEATMARAIEPFFSTKGVGHGTGLGLSMVHGLVTQLGGTLRLASKPDIGTTVELWLPASGEQVDVPQQEALQPAKPRPAGTALLVDDEDLVRMSGGDMLRDLGYTVVEANSGERALELLRQGLIADLLVSDHLMPGLTGVDLARAVRDEYPHIPVLIVSGYAESGGISPDLPRLTKPFRQAELAAMLGELKARGGE
jgi:PAS domain S-box-containing protein